MLQKVEWGEFDYSELFTNCIIKNKLTKFVLDNQGKTPVYSSESTNNGIVGYTSCKANFVVNKKNPYYVIFGDHTRSFNIASESFCVMDNVKVLSMSKIYSVRALMYIISSWKKCVPNKGYSRHWSLAKEVLFKLPMTVNNKIDFEFMESFIAELEAQRIAELDSYLKVTNLKDYTLTKEELQVVNDFESGVFEWREFNLEKLFGNSTRGRRLKSSDRIQGDLPFVTAGETNEGISAFIGNDVITFSENTTTIDMFGSAKYRSYKYGGDDHIAVVHTEKLPKFASIFVTSAIHKSSYTGKFSYSRNFYAKDADELDVSLPTKNNKPNYEVMETLISAVQKLVIKDVVLYADKKIDATKSVVG